MEKCLTILLLLVSGVIIFIMAMMVDHRGPWSTIHQCNDTFTVAIPGKTYSCDNNQVMHPLVDERGSYAVWCVCKEK